MKLFLILSLALLALVSRLAEAQTCGSRLRKDWDMMTATEKTTYRNAIRAAMDSGAYIKFVEMHTDMMSEREAHPYACVTVPYYNWITASARVTSGACSSIGSCSAIARELGGWTSGTVRTLAINGINNSGRCVNVSPLDRFCQLTSTTGAACARAVLERHDDLRSEGVAPGGLDFVRSSRLECRVRPTDVVTMRTGERGINPIQASTDPRVGQFFTGVPNQFAGLMDTRDLGSSSYGYYVSGQVATMYTQCDASPRSRKLAETNSTSHPAMCGVTEDDGYDEDGNDYASQNNYPETDYHGQDDGHQDVVVIDDTGNPIDENTPRDAYVSEDSEKKVVDWYEETLDSMGGDTQENMDDLERQACMFEHVCLGGTMDYTPEFKAIWKVTAPRCKIIVDAILSGDETIKYASWREEMELVFGCPEPSYTNDTSSYYGGSWGSSGSGSWGSSESGSWSSTSTDDVDNSNDTIHFSDVLDDPVTTTDISEPTTDVVEDPVPTTEVVEDPEPITEVVEPTTDVLGDPNVVITSTLDV
ncbi:hypothetical protein PInf_006629 [Phytophthora infestans]|nr:hypothetical protein PInf_006629 [Phytophthora infestans]